MQSTHPLLVIVWSVAIVLGYVCLAVGAIRYLQSNPRFDTDVWRRFADSRLGKVVIFGSCIFIMLSPVFGLVVVAFTLIVDSVLYHIRVDTSPKEGKLE